MPYIKTIRDCLRLNQLLNLIHGIRRLIVADLYFLFCIFLEFQQLVRLLVYVFHSFLCACLDKHISLFSFYRLCCLVVFQETNDLDSRKMDYRIYDRQLIRLVFSRYLSRMKFYEPVDFLSPNPLLRNRFLVLRQSITSTIRSVPFYLLLPRIKQYLLMYNLVTYQTPFLVCQSPAGTTVRGSL